MNRSHSLLLVDDDPSLRQSLAFILRQAGYQVTAAATAEEALQTLSAGPFDLILTDLRMPGMDGIEFLRTLRKDNPDTPVFIFTAHGALNTAIEAMRNGANDYFIKPLKPKELLDRLGVALDSRQQRVRRREIEKRIQSLIQELNAINPPARFQETRDADVPEPSGLTPRILARGPFVLDLLARLTLLDGQPVRLSPTSFNYLAALLRHTPLPVAYEDLVREVQGFELPRKDAQPLARWQIHQLRQALEPEPGKPRYILNERGLGYRLVLPL